jgi:hypothetical protein
MISFSDFSNGAISGAILGSVSESKAFVFAQSFTHQQTWLEVRV